MPRITKTICGGHVQNRFTELLRLPLKGNIIYGLVSGIVDLMAPVVAVSVLTEATRIFARQLNVLNATLSILNGFIFF